MDEKYVKAFNAVATFVKDLSSVFGNTKKPTPLALYHRLIEHIEHIKPLDPEAVNKVLCGFRQFLVTYEDNIINGTLDSIPRGTVIKYGTSETVYLEIQKYIYQTRKDPETREAIRQHLVTISAIIEPDEKKLDELDKRINDLNIDPNTREGEFITGIMHKAKDNMQEMDTNNPGQAIMSLLGSGIIQEMVVGLQQGVSSGEMDMQKLLGSMQSAMGAIMPPPQPSGGGSGRSSKNELEEIKDEEPEKNNFEEV